MILCCLRSSIPKLRITFSLPVSTSIFSGLPPMAAVLVLLGERFVSALKSVGDPATLDFWSTVNN